MDGWAVKKSDCQSDSEVVLKIVGAIQAGAEQTISIESGEACKITTGARIPEGADAIVIVEDSRVDGNNVVITGPAR